MFLLANLKVELMSIESSLAIPFLHIFPGILPVVCLVSSLFYNYFLDYSVKNL